MPKKGPPAPLPDAIFRAKLDGGLDSLQAPCIPEEIPVHNTFIQFGSLDDKEFPQKQHLSTAPAWIGPSISSMIQSSVQPSSPEQPPTQEWSDLGAPKKLPSPKKVPVMRYSLSACSARAAGVSTSSAVVASYDPYGSSPEASVAAKTQTTEDESDDKGTDVDVSPASNARTVVDIGDLPSMGSAQHAEGLCKRCCFFPKGRCQNGKDCEFCHFDHEKRKRKKKKKKKTKQEESDSDEGDEEAAESVASTGGDVGTLGGGSRCGSVSVSAAGGSISLPPAVGVETDPQTAGSIDFGMTASREGDMDAPASGGVDHLPMNAFAQSYGHLQSQHGFPLTAPPAMPPSLLVPVDQPPMSPMRLDGSHALTTQMEVQSSWARNPFDVGASPLGHNGLAALSPGPPVAHPEGYSLFAAPYGGAAMCAMGMGMPGDPGQGEPRLSTYSPFAKPPSYGPSLPQPQVVHGHASCHSGDAYDASPSGYRPPPR